MIEPVETINLPVEDKPGQKFLWKLWNAFNDLVAHPKFWHHSGKMNKKESQTEVFYANNEHNGNWLLSILAVAAGVGFAANKKLYHSLELKLWSNQRAGGGI